MVRDARYDYRKYNMVKVIIFIIGFNSQYI